MFAHLALDAEEEVDDAQRKAKDLDMEAKRLMHDCGSHCRGSIKGPRGCEGGMVGSAAEIERDLSVADMVLTKQRSILHPAWVERLLFTRGVLGARGP
jgi:hypothetical protein